MSIYKKLREATRKLSENNGNPNYDELSQQAAKEAEEADRTARAQDAANTAKMIGAAQGKAKVAAKRANKAIDKAKDFVAKNKK